MGDDGNKAWNEFWARSPNRTQRGGCLPTGHRGLEQAQRTIWHGFAKRLDRGARVLDLATGDGRVLANLLEVRRDLKAIGIDRAVQLPPPPRGAKLRGGIAMDALPFPDNSFAAVTSQFGFEYGDVERCAAEIVRVMRPGGLCALLVHRAEGPVVAHNRRRAQQIEWAISERDLPGIAKRSLQLRQLGIAAVPAEIEQAPGAGARLFGERSAAWEIAEAIRRALSDGRGDSPANLAALIDEIVARAQNELGRIASLEEAADKASSPRRIPGSLIAAGLAPLETEEVSDGLSDKPFAQFHLLKLDA